MRIAVPFATALLLTLGALSAWAAFREPASSFELLVNPGFEQGIDGWSWNDGILEPVDTPFHSGGLAARFSDDGQPQATEVYQFVGGIIPGQTYQFSGWIYLDDPGVDQVFLRLVWLDENGEQVTTEDSTSNLTIDTPVYQFLTTVADNAPAAARSARVGIRVIATSDFTIYIDDMSFDGPAPTPTPLETPSPSPTPIPSPTLTPSLSPSPTPTANATRTPTPTPSVTPAATPSPTLAPTASPASPPTAAPTSTSTSAPTVTATKAATPTPTPTTPPIPTPTPAPTPTPSSVEPEVFTSLVNGGFEDARSDGTPYGWHKFGGSYSVVAQPAGSSGSVLQFNSGTASTKWVYQAVAITGGKHYEASALIRYEGSDVRDTFVRLSFYASDNTSGSAIESFDSDLVEAPASSWVRVTTGPVEAPLEARSVRVRLMLRPASAAPATVYFDDATFGETGAPTPSSTPNATSMPSPTPAPSTSAPTSAPTLAPTAMPTPTPTRAPPASDEDQEPIVFGRLTNGGFEQTRDDGTPYGWHKIGGEIAVTNGSVSEGAAALAFDSSTASTKWAYQNVRVEPGGYYEASAFAMPQTAPSEAFLRISWYGTEDGSGQAISSDDSESSVTGAPQAFIPVSTGPVQAPSEARSAKIKLMLRPGTESPVVAYFDGVTFFPTQSPPPGAGVPAAGGNDTPDAVSNVGNQSPNPSTNDTAAPATVTPAVLAAERTPIRLANVKPSPAPQAVEPIMAGGNDYDWAIVLSIVVPLIGFGLLGAHELIRMRRDSE